MFEPLMSPVLRAAGAMTMGLLAYGGAWAALQERRHARDYEGYTPVTSQSPTGNAIKSYFAAGSADVIVLIPGLSSTVSTVAGLGDALRGMGFSVLLHNRAGYGASVVLAEGPFHIGEAVQDLAATINRSPLPDAARIHIAGHSLGAYLGHEYAVAHPKFVRSVSYLDPLHPMELCLSKGQRMGAAGVNLAVRTVTPFTRAGIALLYRPEVLTYAVGYEFEDRVRADLGAPSTWLAARREWKTLHSLLLDGRELGRLPSSVRTQVIAAENTLRSDPSQRELYDSYSADLHVITGSNHQSMMTSRLHQKTIAGLFNDFVGVAP